MDVQSFYAGPVSAGFIAATGFALTILVLWTIVWKGMALWKAAQEKNKVWFVVLLLVNTVGILDILYIYFFSKKKSAPVVEAPKM